MEAVQQLVDYLVADHIRFTEKNSSGETKTIGSIHFTVQTTDTQEQ